MNIRLKKKEWISIICFLMVISLVLFLSLSQKLFPRLVREYIHKPNDLESYCESFINFDIYSEGACNESRYCVLYEPTCPDPFSNECATSFLVPTCIPRDEVEKETE